MTDENRGRQRVVTAATPAVTVEEWAPEVEMDLVSGSPGWDGRKTRLISAVNMIRDGKVLGAGDPFVVSASYDRVSGRWFGPEAGHVEYLFGAGCIHGSEQARAREAQAHAVEIQRGVYQETRFEGGQVVQRPMLEFKQRSKEEVEREWERPLAEGRRAEAQEARADSTESIDNLTSAIRQLVQGAQAPHAGAEGPGSAHVGGRES